MFGKKRFDVKAADIENRLEPHMRVVIGHFSGNSLLEFNQRQTDRFTLATVLREPFARTVSQLLHGRHVAMRDVRLGNPFYGIARLHHMRPWLDLSDEEYFRRIEEVHAGTGQPMLDTIWNFQSCFAAGIHPLEARSLGDDEVFERARAVLDKFDSVGISENLVLSMRHLSHTLALPQVYDGVFRANTSRSNKNTLGAEITSAEAAAHVDEVLIRDYLNADQRLYEYALERLQRETAAIGLSGDDGDAATLLAHHEAASGPLTEPDRVSSSQAVYSLQDGIIGSGWYAPTHRDDGKNGRWSQRPGIARLHLNVPAAWRGIDIAFTASLTDHKDVEALEVGMNGKPVSITAKARGKRGDYRARIDRRPEGRRLSLEFELGAAQESAVPEKGVFIRKIVISPARGAE